MKANSLLLLVFALWVVLDMSSMYSKWYGNSLPSEKFAKEVTVMKFEEPLNIGPFTVTNNIILDQVVFLISAYLIVFMLILYIFLTTPWSNIYGKLLTVIMVMVSGGGLLLLLLNRGQAEDVVVVWIIAALTAIIIYFYKRFKLRYVFNNKHDPERGLHLHRKE